MTNAIRMHELGGPEVLVWESIDVPSPGPGEALIRQTAVGLNYIDVYHRTGLYPVPSMPAIIGNEGAGVVEAVGDGVTEVAAGDRVAYCMSLGSYTQRRLIPSRLLVRLPDGISDRQAAAMMLKGCTVQYLLRRAYPLKAGQTILFHAAAGGCGLIACQWAKHLGATVIGTVSTSHKAEVARAHGCDHVVVYTQENFVERVKELTNGAGVPVVYDSVGKDTFMGSLDCLGAAGAHGELRQLVGRCGAIQSRCAHCQRVAVSHATDAGDLHGHARRARANQQGVVRRRLSGGGQDRGQSDICARGRRAGAPRSRGSTDDRFYCVPHRGPSSLGLLVPTRGV